MRRSVRLAVGYLFITLLLVPVFYAIFVLDLKWITWDVSAKEGSRTCTGYEIT